MISIPEALGVLALEAFSWRLSAPPTAPSQVLVDPTSTGNKGKGETEPTDDDAVSLKCSADGTLFIHDEKGEEGTGQMVTAIRQC